MIRGHSLHNALKQFDIRQFLTHVLTGGQNLWDPLRSASGKIMQLTTLALGPGDSGLLNHILFFADLTATVHLIK